jgi:hypothetical protein
MLFLTIMGCILILVAGFRYFWLFVPNGWLEVRWRLGEACAENNREVWVCGRIVSETPDGSVWECQGVFTAEQAARDACRDETYFIGPETLNVVLPAETLEWERAYFPLAINIGDVIGSMKPGEV